MRISLIAILSPILVTIPSSLSSRLTLSSFLSQMAVAAPVAHTQLPPTHSKARGPVYPGRAADDPTRTPVPDDKVSWTVVWSDYKPIQYTAASVLKGPVWADPDLISDSSAKIGTFNKIDGKVSIYATSILFHIFIAHTY